MGTIKHDRTLGERAESTIEQPGERGVDHRGDPEGRPRVSRRRSEGDNQGGDNGI